MHFFSTFILLGSACWTVAELSAGQRKSLMAMKSVFERQIQFCTPVPPPVTCERSCGPGNIQCISFPNCYNPSAGETCCSDGSYCPEGYYCTDAGCCPNGSTLSECGAIFTLSVIPPPAETPTSPSPSSTSSPTPTSSSTTPKSTSSASSPTLTPTPSDSSPTSSPSESPSPTKISPTFTIPKIPTAPSSSSSSSASSTPATSTVQPGAAGRTFGVNAIHVALGWFGALFLVL